MSDAFLTTGFVSVGEADLAWPGRWCLS